MRTTLDIDAHILTRLRAEAVRRSVPFKEVVAGALRRGLQGAARRATAPARLPAHDMGEPLISIDKARHFAAALEDDEVLRQQLTTLRQPA